MGGKEKDFASGLVSRESDKFFGGKRDGRRKRCRISGLVGSASGTKRGLVAGDDDVEGRLNTIEDVGGGVFCVSGWAIIVRVVVVVVVVDGAWDDSCLF